MFRSSAVSSASCYISHRTKSFSIVILDRKLYLRRESYVTEDPVSFIWISHINVDSSWNVMAHGDAREGKWRGNWRMVWVASTLHTTSEHGVSSITTADEHISATSNRLNWSPRRFKWTRLFRRKTKYGFCARAITFQLASTKVFV